MRSAPLLRMNDGREIPQAGLGVYKVPDDDTPALVEGALELGCRHIDTAALYHNERGVGEGVRRSGVPRDEIFVTTKVWNTDHGRDATLRAFDASLDRLGLDYVDLYLIHWPVPSQNLYVETWHTLEELRRDGRVRSIGVSNFEPEHLERLRAESATVPAVNQVELHPWLPQAAVREYGREHGILTEAWSPLARGRLLESPELAAIADRLDRTPAQVVLRWHIELGNVVIPKSTSLDRVRENFDVFDFELSDDDRAAIAALESGRRTGLHPSDG